MMGSDSHDLILFEIALRALLQLEKIIKEPEAKEIVLNALWDIQQRMDEEKNKSLQ